MKEYIITDFEDIFKKKIITFYYCLLKYILKNKYYIYHIPFLLETRNNIINLIRNNLVKLYPSIEQDKDFKTIIEYVLKEFISYNYYYTQSLNIKKNKRNTSNPDENSNQMYNYSTGPSIHGPFSNQTYKNENNNNSGRHFEKGRPLEIVSDDVCFRILQNSDFILNINKIDNNTYIKYEKVIINDKKEQIDIDKVKNISSQIKNLNENYIKFKSILQLIEDKIKSDYINNFSFKIVLNFKEKYQNSLTNLEWLECLYTLEIPAKLYKKQFPDEYILNKELKAGGGLLFLLHEVNKME